MNEKFIEFAKTIEPDFLMQPDQESFYASLINYFKNEPCGWDLSKGLLLNGSVGAGKTLAMRIMQASRSVKSFGMITCRHVVREYMINGVEIIDRYGRKDRSSFFEGQKITYYSKCFDDFGAEETNQKLFGNNQNVMLEILLDRYELFISNGMITHLTTNLTPELIEQQYGNRLRDRLREMMNYITMPGTTKRK